MRMTHLVLAGVLLTAGLAGGLAGCRTTEPPTRQAWIKLQRWNKDTSYRVQPLGDAFRLHVLYPRTTQDLPPSVGSHLARLTRRIAAHYAEGQDRAVRPIPPNAATIQAGRNPLSGQTYWEAVTDVYYQNPTPPDAPQSQQQ